MNKETRKKLIKEFKHSTKNKNLMPTYDNKYGNKYKGNFFLEHFILYSLIRNKLPEKNTHSVNSKKYLFSLSLIEYLAKGKNNVNNNYYQNFYNNCKDNGIWLQTDKEILIRSFQKIMPSITIKEIQKLYYNID